MWIILLVVFIVSFILSAMFGEDTDAGQLVIFVWSFVGLTIVVGCIGLFDIVGDWTLINFFKSFL